MRCSNHRASTVARRLALSAVLACLPLVSSAQEGEPGYIHVVFADVKPSAGADFEAAIREIGALQQEMGYPFMHVYQRVRGDNGFTIFGMDADLNDLPAMELETPLAMRITGALDGITRLTLRMLPEISVGSGSVEPSGNHMRVVVRTVSPGTAADFIELNRDEIVPALREAGMTDRRGGHVYAGGNRNSFVFFTFADEFDGGGVDLAAVMGQRQWDSVVERANAMQVSVEDYRYMYRPDLSFTAAGQ